MSQDSEAMKQLVKFKEELKKRVKEAETELKDLQQTLEALDTVLLEKGFKRAQIAKESPTPTSSL